MVWMSLIRFSVEWNSTCYICYASLHSKLKLCRRFSTCLIKVPKSVLTEQNSDLRRVGKEATRRNFHPCRLYTRNGKSNRSRSGYLDNQPKYDLRTGRKNQSSAKWFKCHRWDNSTSQSVRSMEHRWDRTENVEFYWHFWWPVAVSFSEHNFQFIFRFTFVFIQQC